MPSNFPSISKRVLTPILTCLVVKYQFINIDNEQVLIIFYKIEINNFTFDEKRLGLKKLTLDVQGVKSWF